MPNRTAAEAEETRKRHGIVYRDPQQHDLLARRGDLGANNGQRITFREGHIVDGPAQRRLRGRTLVAAAATHPTMRVDGAREARDHNADREQFESLHGSYLLPYRMSFTASLEEMQKTGLR